MDISVAQQVYVFLFSVVLGTFLGLFYDCFRILRIAVCWNTFWIFIQDLIFWLCAAFFTFSYIEMTNSGELRWYILFGALCGAVFYFLTLGILVMKSAKKIAYYIKKFLRWIIHLILLPFYLLRRIIAPKRVLKRRKLKNTKKISQKYFKSDAKRDKMSRNTKNKEKYVATGDR